MFIYVYILYFQSIFYRQLQYLFFSGARNPLCNWCFFKEKVFFCGKLSTTFWWPKTSSKKLLASAHSGGGSPFVCFAWPTLNAWSAACQGCSLNTWSLHEPHQTKNLQGKATWHVEKICEHQAKKKKHTPATALQGALEPLASASLPPLQYRFSMVFSNLFILFSSLNPLKSIASYLNFHAWKFS